MSRLMLLILLSVSSWLVVAGCADKAPVVYVYVPPADAGPDAPPGACIAGRNCIYDLGPEAVRATPDSFATFNAGLARGAVPFSVERRSLIITALQQLFADVVCLQEVWSDEDASAIIAGSSATYPHSFRHRVLDPSPSKVRCPDHDSLAAYQSCAASQCDPSKPAAACRNGACQTPFQALPEDCRLCLLSHSDDELACAQGGAKDFMYDGSNGLLLLSRKPIQQTGYLPMKTTLAQRGVLRAQIGLVTALCAQLPGQQPGVAYPSAGPFKSWVEEHAAAVETTKAAASSGCTVLLTDFNAGPAGPGLVPELADAYHSMRSAGFLESWLTPDCTVCRSNVLGPGGEDRWLDHIFFRGCVGEPLYSRILDSPVSIQSGGKSYPTQLSHHFGVQARWPQ